MEEQRGEDRELFRDMFMKRATYLLHKRILREREVYNLVKDFFKEYLKIDYEFTKTELEQELTKVYLEPNVRRSVDALIRHVFKMQYSEAKVDDKELRSMLKSFIRIVDVVVKEQKSQSFLQRLISVIKGNPVEIPVPQMNPAQLEQIRSSIEQPSIVEKEKPVEDKKEPEQDKQEPKPDSKPEWLKELNDDSQGDEPKPEEPETDEKLDDHEKTDTNDAQEKKEVEDTGPKQKDEKKKHVQPKPDSANKTAQKKTDKKKTPEDRIAELISEAEKCIPDDLAKAKSVYKSINMIYSNLQEEKQHDIYPRINALYDKIYEATQGS